MPRAAPRPCTHPGCHVLTDGGRCEKHQKLVRQQQDEQRERAVRSLYGYRWQKARAGFLALHPKCECGDCKSSGRVRPATVVDHVIPHRGCRDLFWQRDNWMAMAKVCHDAKTAREDGGFGNALSPNHK